MKCNHLHRQRFALVVIVTAHAGLDGKKQKKLPKKLIDNSGCPES